MKRVLSLVVALALVLTLVPFGALAAEEVTGAGTFDDPEIITDIDGSITATLTEGNGYEYYYEWTAAEAGTVSVYPDSETTSESYDIVVNDASVWDILEEDPEATPSYSMEVAAGEAISIWVFNDNVAESITFYIGFEPLSGTEGNPLTLLSNQESQITLAAGQTMYCTNSGNVNGMYFEMTGGDASVVHNGATYTTTNGAVSFVCTQTGMWAPGQYVITNTGAAEATYTVNFVAPVGTMDNADVLEIGDNVTDIAAGTQGYYYDWTATEAGTLTVTVSAEDGWSYSIINQTTSVGGDMHYSNDDPVVASQNIVVEANDVIRVIVNTFNPDDIYNAPAGTVTVTASFVAGVEGGEEGGETTDPTEPEEPEDGVITSGTNVTATVAEPVTYTWTTEKAGTLTVTMGAASPGWRYTISDAAGNTVGLPKTGSTEKSAEFELAAGETYTFSATGWSSSEWAETSASITYTLTFVPSTDEGGEVEKAEYEVSETALVLGDNTLTLLDTAVTTIYVYEPTETGVYTFTGPAGAIVGYWGAGSWFLSNPNSTTNTCEWTCTGVGQSAYIGVSGVEGSFNLNVAKTGDYTVVEIPEVIYENKATLSPFTLPEGATLGSYVDVYDETVHTAVKGEDGYYHLDGVDGDILLVDMNYQDIVLSDALNSERPVMYAYTTDENGDDVKYNIGAAVQEYEAVMDENGYYPLTEDLILFYDVYANGAGTYSFHLTGDYNEENAWMYCMRTVDTLEAGEEGGETTDPTDPSEPDDTNPTNAAFAVIGDETTYYETGSDIITVLAELNAGETVILYKDIDLGTEYITVSGNAVLDLNGCSLTNKKSGSYAPISVTGKLTIQDTSADADGLIQNTNSGSYGLRVETNSTAEATLLSGNIVGTSQGVRVNTGTFYGNGGSISTTTAGNYGVYVSDGAAAEFNGSDVTANGSMPYAVYAATGSTVKITAGHFGRVYGSGLTGNITGGYYTDSISDGYIAANCEIVSNDDATYLYKVQKVGGETEEPAVGTQENPAQLQLDTYNAAPYYGQETGAYYLTWTAPADGTLTLTMAEDETEQPWIMISSDIQNTYWMNLEAFDVTVAEGEVITLTVETYSYAAADYQIYAVFVKDDGAVATIGENRYMTLADAVAAAADGDTITLIKETSGAGVVIDKSITIDFGGYTYSLTVPVGSTGTVSNGLQILSGNTVTLQNGTLNVAEENKGDFYILVQNYADLTVKDMTLDGTNLDKYSTTDGDSYTLSNNSGNVSITGYTNIIANDEGDLAYAFDVCKFGSYTAPVVTVDTTGTITGNIEVAEGLDENLQISAGTYTMDVTEWCVDGMVAIDNGYGSYEVNYPAGSEQNPILIYSYGATIEAAANESLFCQSYVGGMIMTISGEGEFSVVYGDKTYTSTNGTLTTTEISGSYMSPAALTFVNGDTAATYTVSFASPAGAMENPVALVLGENTAEIAANSSGYYYTWTATEAGTLSITMPDGDWTYAINNLTAGKYGDTQWSDSDPVVNPGTVAVSAGDEIQIMVNTYDSANPFGAPPAGTLTITAAFEAAPEEEPLPEGTVMSESVTADKDSKYVYTYEAAEDGTLTITIGDGSTNWSSDTIYFEGLTTTTVGTASGSAEDSYTVDVVAGIKYRVRVWETSGAALAATPLTVTFAAAGSGEEITVTEVASGTNADASVESPILVPFTPEANGTLTVVISGDPGYKISVIASDDSTVGLPKSSSTGAEQTLTYELTAGETYTVRMVGYVNYDEGTGAITYNITFTPAAGGGEGGETEKAEYEVSDTALVVGDNTLTLLDTAVTTIYVFEPTEEGTYTITGPEGSIVGYWGAGSWFLTNPNSTTNTYEWECTGVGQSAYIGVSGVEGEFTLTVTKTAEGGEQGEIVYETYVNEHTPSADFGTLTGDETLLSVNLEEAHAAVLGTDGYYHLDTADGPVLYVDLITDEFDFTTAWGAYGALTMRGTYEEDGVTYYYDFLTAMTEYYNVMGSGDGLYPLTIDLMRFIKGFGANQGWYNTQFTPFAAITETVNADTAWMVLCRYEEPAPELFKLEGITMTLGNRLDMNFVIDTAKLEGDGHYAVIVKSYADGTTTKVTVDQADWENFDDADWYYFTFSGVAAKEMTDTITVNVYNADGEQVTYEWVDSVEAYCIRMLPQAQSEEEATLYVDMLNYGAAAQSYFGYKTDDLANADLTAEQQAKATQSVSMEDKRSSGTGYVGSALTLESCIQLDIVFDGSQIEGAATAVATYTDHYGAAQRVEYEKFGEYEAGMPMISLTGMSVADCSQMVTLTVYDAEGKVLSTVEDSVESYVARMTESDPLFETIMKFATSSYNYFH